MSCTTTETPEKALARIQSMGWSDNDALAIMAFYQCGIDPEDVTPRQNVLTFKAWKAAGRQVAKGAIGVPVTVWIPKRGKQESPEPTPEEKGDGEGKKRRGGMWPKTTRLFHISQTIPKDSPKGTRPDAWNNPALIREGTYTAESPEQNQPLHPPVELSTGKTITHTRHPNGHQIARPAMTAAESAEYDQQRSLFA